MQTLDLDSGLLNSSVVKGLQVLSAFGRGRSELTLTQLMEITGIEKSAVQRFTATLVALGYLRKDPVRKLYSVAPKLLHLGTSFLRTNALVARATPFLLDWSRERNETVNIGELEGFEVIITNRVRSLNVVNSDVSVGSSFPWHATSIGQAIVAHAPAELRDHLVNTSPLPALTARTITDRRLLNKRLSEVHERGYAFCESESYDEDISIAAPILNTDGVAVAAAATAVLSTQWTKKSAIEKLVPAVQLLARAITGARTTNS